MIKRRSCIYKGKIIGIESIYTIQEGKQIYIPGKVEELRELGRKKELFCPCGCGAVLGLVAGDRMIRGAHFRSFSNNMNISCIASEESDYSIESKILLKNWFEKEVEHNVECRVQLSNITDSNRKFELTFYDKISNIGLCYWLSRSNITDEKLNEIENNVYIKRVFHVIDVGNAGETGQYPESMMKIQNKQGYILFLTPAINFEMQAQLTVCFYAVDASNLWKKIEVLKDYLIDFNIDINGQLIWKEHSLQKLVTEKLQAYENEQRQIQEEIESLKHEECFEKEKELREREEVYQISRGIHFMNGKDILEIDFDIEKEIYDQKNRIWKECIKCHRRSIKRDFHPATVKNNMGICNECIERDGFPEEFLPNTMKERIN